MAKKKTLQVNLTTEEKSIYIAACEHNQAKSASSDLRRYVLKVNRKYIKELLK